MTGPTICSDCDNLSVTGKSDPPWRWLCMKHPRMDGFGFVTRDTWDAKPPYLYCVNVNGGACPLFVQKREPQPEDNQK